MELYSIINALPFWILGIPLLVAIISYVQMPRQGDHVPRDLRDMRRSIAGESFNRAGEPA